MAYCILWRLPCRCLVFHSYLSHCSWLESCRSATLYLLIIFFLLTLILHSMSFLVFLLTLLSYCNMCHTPCLSILLHYSASYSSFLVVLTSEPSCSKTTAPLVTCPCRCCCSRLCRRTYQGAAFFSCRRRFRTH